MRHAHVDVPLQYSLAAHAVVQVPQCVGSAVVSTQFVPHNVDPVGHAHEPDEHVANAPHFFPHPPQLLSSVVGSTHAVPQRISEDDAHVHVPSLHVEPVGHFVPHAPQLSGSELVSMHSVPHIDEPGRHLQVPETQEPPEPHGLLQTPQCFTSLARFAHSGPVGVVQVVSPALHPHTPATHTPPGMHFVPHALQLFGSLSRSLHVASLPVPHVTVPAGQEHAPAVQVPPAGQGLSQPPQCASELFVSTQSLPQVVLGARQGGGVSVASFASFDTSVMAVSGEAVASPKSGSTS